MSFADFLLIYALSLATMLLCRCIPIFVLKGKSLSPNVQEGLNLIPPAAFAALVANDLLSPTMFDAGWWPGLLPIAAALSVLLVARKSGSLIGCAITGVAAYALLSMI